MKRRAALAVALCLTTIVGFCIVAYGTQIGFFGGSSGTGDAAAHTDSTAAPTQPPAAAAPSQPQVIEQFVYRDVFVSNPDAASAGSTGSGAPRRPTAKAAPATHGSSPPPPAGPPPQQTPQAAPRSLEFTGQVIAVSGPTFTVDSPSGQLTVTLAPNTSVHGGAIAVGATVKVHGYLGADGKVVASEVEVAGDE